MKIASSEMQMHAKHVQVQQRQVSESLRSWQETAPLSAAPSPATDPVTLSVAGQSAAASDKTSRSDQALADDPRTQLIRLMIEALTGQKLKLFDPAALHTEHAQAATETTQVSAAIALPSTSSGMEYVQQTHYQESEHTRFSASGTVLTADGQKISFELELSMSRSYVEDSSTRIAFGQPERKVDPLVLNFSGNAASLINQRFSFDLDADGSAENIASLSHGSGYLVFDRNRDGRINNGSEMFGPTGGDGFAELALLDDDGNGWIDENDAAFSRLMLWQGADGANQNLQTLGSAGVGAISLQHIGTPFQLKNDANGLLGEIRTSGIFLHEDGTTGTIQQIDLSA